MKQNIFSLWLLVLVAFLSTLTACASQDTTSSGPVSTVAQTPPPKATPALPAATPTPVTQQRVTDGKDSLLGRLVESYGPNAQVTPDNSDAGARDANTNPNLPSTTKLKFSDTVGKQAPDFTLESLKDGAIKLSSYRGKNVVLFFTEGTMCYPACWDQMARFGSDERFNNKDTVVLSIGVNPRSEWEKIVRQAPQVAKAPILLDTTKAVSLTYDALSLKSSMHPGDLPGHTYFVIDREGVIRFTFDDPDMGIRNDRLAEELKKLAP